MEGFIYTVECAQNCINDLWIDLIREQKAALASVTLERDTLRDSVITLTEERNANHQRISHLDQMITDLKGNCEKTLSILIKSYGAFFLTLFRNSFTINDFKTKSVKYDRSIYVICALLILDLLACSFF